MGIAKHLSIILPSPGVVLGEGHKVQIIKQAFHSLSQLPIMAWESMPTSPGLPCDLGPVRYTF